MLSRAGQVFVRSHLVHILMSLYHWCLNKLSNFALNLSRSVLEDDDICVVAQLLGDLMAYRASGTGHLELVAGSFLLTLQSKTQFYSLLVNIHVLSLPNG